MLELPDTINPGDELDVQIAPFGEWPNRNAKGEAVVQHVTPAAVERLVANFTGEILVDIDHNSIEGGTEAAAWVTSLRADPNRGLVGTFKFTDVGADAVSNRRYRFVSVAWILDADGELERLDSVALTNRPNLPVRPILNRMPTAKQPVVNSDDGQPKGTPAMDKLKEILGLAPDASDEDVFAAVADLKSSRDELEKAKAEAEADEFVEENKDCVKDPEQLKNAYLANKDLAKAMIANCKRPEAKPATQQTLLNSTTAKTPVIGKATKEQLAALPPSKRAAFYREHKADFEA